MDYKIIGNTVPAVEFTLNRGEAIYTQRGGMTWKTPGVSMQTNTKGGIMKGLGRMFAGESIFMSTYTAERDGEKLAIGSTVPGGVVPVNLDDWNNGIIFQKGAFLCAEPSVDCKIELTKKLSTGLFGGEGFILQSASGNGKLFLEVDGDQVEIILGENEVLQVDTGNVVAFEKSVRYEIETVKGLSNIILGGEGLFLTRLTGPGRVILQTLNFNDFAGRILALQPSK
ncbi:MAG: TIGR00266 family protein [Clostridia bacterium]|nr:TIGR00266 family protein [Clostridia bacterium]